MTTAPADRAAVLDRPHAILAALLLGAAAFFAFNLADPFVSDDWHHLWIAGHRTQPLLGYFLTNYEGTASGGSYRPLVNVLWAGVHAAGGGLTLSGRLFGHAVALGAHLLVVALVFSLGRMLMSGRRGTALGAVAAASFAVMPNHPEAVNWVGAASDPIATAAVLAGLLVYLDAQRVRRLHWTHPTLPAAAMAVGLLAKETAIVLPVVIGLHALLTMGRPWRSWLMRTVSLLAPLALVAVAYLLVRYRATGLLYGYYGAERISVDLMVATRTFLAVPVSLFVALGDRTDVMNGLYGTIDTHLEAYLLALAVPVVLLITRARRITWWLAASFLVAIVPVMQFGLNHLSYGNDEGERYAYMPSAFAALTIAWVAAGIWAKRRWLRPALIAVAAFLLFSTGLQLGAKNALWFRTSRAAEAVVAAWPERTAEQVFVSGLPDNRVGIPLWRNGFAQRLEAEGRRPVELVVTDIRSHADPRTRLTVEDRGDGTFLYRIVHSLAAAMGVLLGPTSQERTPTSYGYVLPPFIFEVYALSYRTFADEAVVEPVPTRPDAAAAFWTGTGWDIRPLHATAGDGVE